MKHHTKTKGDLGVAKVYASLVKKEFLVMFPTSEHSPFDLVAYKKGHFLRIQVKARTEKMGKVSFRLGTSWADKHGSHHKQYDLLEIDYFAIYNLSKDEIYYVPVNQLTARSEMTLRVQLAKNNQQAVNSVDNYRDISV